MIKRDAVLAFSQPEKVPDHQRESTGVTDLSISIQCRFEYRRLLSVGEGACRLHVEDVSCRIWSVECGVQG